MNLLYLCNQQGIPDQDRATALVKAGWTVRVLDWREQNLDYRWDISESSPFLTYSYCSGPNLRTRLNAVFGLLRRILTGPKSDALIYNYQKPEFLIAAIAVLFRGGRAYSLFDSKFSDYERNIYTDLVKLAFLWPYKGVLAASPEAASYLHFLGRRNIALYYCAIDTERFLRGPEVVSWDSLAFISVGRFIDRKNFHTLLDAFEIYRSVHGGKRRLRLCGYGEEGSGIQERVRGSQVLREAVEMVGYVSSSELPELLKKSLALLLVSSSEQFGIVVTEAMASGVPCIVSSVCGVSCLIDPFINGYLVSSDSAAGIAGAMAAIESDRRTWNNMSSAAEKGAAQADVRQFVSTFERLIEADVS